MDDDREQHEQEERERHGIVAPGETPKWPMHIEAGEEHDRGGIADAAWAKSHGSMQAYEQLCRDHVEGRIDLLEHEPVGRMDRMPATADQRAIRQAAAGDAPGLGDDARRRPEHTPMRQGTEALAQRGRQPGWTHGGREPEQKGGWSH